MSTNEEKIQESLARIEEMKKKKLVKADFSDAKELQIDEDTVVPLKGKLPKPVDFSKCSKVSKEMD